MSRSVLIVDDSRLARLMVAGLIRERWPEAAIREVDTAAGALEAARSEAPDLVVLDHNMPGASGLDIVAGLREAAPGAHLALVTANVQSSIRQRAEEAGCRFVAKPVTAEKIDRLLADIGASA